jgi:hypothetical protein
MRCNKNYEKKDRIIETLKCNNIFYPQIPSYFTEVYNPSKEINYKIKKGKILNLKI